MEADFKVRRARLLKEIKSALETVNSFDGLIESLNKTFDGIKDYFEETKDYFSSEEIEKKRILYVDVENYPKSIVTPLIIFLLEYFKNISESQKILVFDECWSF